MTPAQQAFYWRLWRDVCDANRWQMVRGRLAHDPQRLGEHGKQVWSIAEQRAAEAARAMTLDDLRHGAHMLALGRDKSMKALSNPEFNRVKVAFQLLIDPENLAALMEWDHPEISQRQSFVAFLKKQAPEATLIAISRNAFDTIFWEDLPIQKLRWLAKKLKDRKRD